MDIIDKQNEQLRSEVETLRSELSTLKQVLKEQQTSQEQLKKDKSNLEFFLESVAGAITAQNPDGKMIYANNAAAHLLGFSSAPELLSTPLAEVYQQYELLDASGNAFPLAHLPGRRILQGEYNPPEEIVRFRVRATGEEHWSIVKAAPVLNTQQQLEYLVNVFYDVTRLKQAETALQLQREWFEVTLTSIGDAVIATDVEGRVTFMNKVAENLTGWSLEAGSGQPLHAVFQIVNEATRQNVENPVHKVLHQGTVVGLANHTLLLARDGRSTPIDDSAAPIRGSDGKINGVVLIFRDVSERKEAERNDHFLTEASHLLASSLDYQTILNQLARLTLPRLADYCLIDLFEEVEVTDTEPEFETGEAKKPEDNRILRRVVVAHVNPLKEKRLQEEEMRFLPDLKAAYGIGKVLRTAEPEFMPKIGEVELERLAYSPEHLQLLKQLAPCSAISVPMVQKGRVLGALSLFFLGEESRRTYSQEGLTFLIELAQRAAMAVENAQLYQKEQLLKTRQAYLARASEVLSSSLDYELTLQRVAELAVPLLADWCTVHVVREGLDQTSELTQQPLQVGLAHWKPEKVEWIKRLQAELDRLFPYDPEAPTGLPNVLKTGEAEFYPFIPEEMLLAAASDDYSLQILREIGFSSLMVVPMVARDRVLGAIQLVTTTESGRVYTHADLAFAKELARRAAMAVDNARLYQEAQRAISAQNEVNRLKDRFLSIASHELRTPLTSIKGFTQLLQRSPMLQKFAVEEDTSYTVLKEQAQFTSVAPQAIGGSTISTSPHIESLTTVVSVGEDNGAARTVPKDEQERTRRILFNITTQVGRMDKLIGEMLDVSKIQSGKLELQLTPGLNLVELIQRVIEQQQMVNPKRVIQLLNPLENVTGDFDEARLEQVLNNLISNALKYSPLPTQVEVGLQVSTPKVKSNPSPIPAESQLQTPDDESTPLGEEATLPTEVVVWVKDKGYGISEEGQAHIFESFYRVRTIENQAVDGLGLGLYISHQIIQRHGGRMWLKSKPGEGSTFYFALPLEKGFETDLLN